MTRAERQERRESRRLLAFIERTAREVERWPAWMKGKPDPATRRPPTNQEPTR